VGSPSILRIERLNYGLGAVVALASLLTQSQSIALGVCVGVALTCVNFFVLPKMVGMMLAVAAAVLFLPIDPIAFTVGYSIFIVSIVIETIYSSIFVNEPANGSNDG
jgi:hypothetical protein